MTMKYSKNFERDWKFYMHSLNVFNFAGKPALEIIQSPSGGPNAKECFCIYDSTGDLKPCVNPELLQRVLICKASVNLHIKLWAQGMAQGLLFQPELSEYLDSLNAPGWVMKAVINQAGKQK